MDAITPECEVNGIFWTDVHSQIPMNICIYMYKYIYIHI